MSKFLLKISRQSKSSILFLSVILLLAIGCVDYFTGVELSISIFYLLPIVISSWYVNRKSGFALSAAGAFVWYAADFLNAHGYSHPVIPYWNAFLMLGTFLIVAEIFSALKLTSERENQLAIKVQNGLLPKEVPVYDSLQISVTWQPFGHVSGDYYDFVRLDEHKLGICIADVAGHGVPAALLMSNIQAGFRVIIQNDYLPPNVCKKLNQTIKQHQLSDKFVSFFYGIIDLEEKSFMYSNAGHPPPFIVKQNGLVTQLSKGGTMLGVVRDYRCEYEKINLADGDVILLYTDGLTEAQNLGAEQFGEENIINLCKANKYLDSHEIKNNIINAVNQFNSKNEDDITLLILKYEE